MSWNNGDKNGFENCIQQNVGQIDINSEFGKLIMSYAANKNFKSFLEIGTWNGLGSTKCFIESFINRDDEYKFYSLECNKEKVEFAYNYYLKNCPNLINQKIFILNEVIVSKDDISDIFTMFPEANQEWLNVDLENLNQSKNFWSRNDTPKFFDVILLDGGEYTTYYEFLKIKDKCKVLILDDTNTDKCKKILEILSNDNSWECVYNQNIRNGVAIFNKK